MGGGKKARENGEGEETCGVSERKEAGKEGQVSSACQEKEEVSIRRITTREVV